MTTRRSFIRRAVSGEHTMTPFLPRRFSFSRMVRSVNVHHAMRFIATVNCDKWCGRAAGTVICTQIMYDAQPNGDTHRARFRFRYRPSGWTPPELAIFSAHPYRFEDFKAIATPAPSAEQSPP